MENNSYLIIRKIIQYLSKELLNLDKRIRTDKNKTLMQFLIVSILKDFECCLLLIEHGYYAGAMLPLKRILEAWRLQIIFHCAPEWIEIYETDKKECKNQIQTKHKSLGELVDKLLSANNIHPTESSKFYDDFLKKYYEKACAYSHLDYEELKQDLLDDGVLIVGSNVIKDQKNKYYVTLKMVLALELELINDLNWINTKGIETEYRQLLPV